MNMPRRLMDGDPAAFESLLARAAACDAPSADARERVFRGLGFSGAAAAAATMAGGAAASAKTGSWFAIAAKWLVISIVGAGALVAIGVASARWLAGSFSTQTASDAVVTEAPRMGGSAVPGPSAAPAQAALTPEDLPLVAPTTVGVAPSTSPAHAAPTASAAGAQSSTPPASASSALAEELKLVDEARAAMRAGDARRALALLDQHDKDFGAGRMATEVLVLRIEALWRTGSRAQASRMATEFIGSYPDSPLCERLRPYASQAARDGGVAP